MFGVNCSPFIAHHVAQSHAKQHQGEYPRASEAILLSTYMDDSMDSVEDVETAVQLYKDLSALWSSAGMKTHKWMSNSQEVLKNIPQTECVSAVDLDKGTLPVTKTLGMTWVPQDDCFTYDINMPEDGMMITKRNFLKKIATLFGPWD